ncbi:3'-5' exonuclease [Serratia microhaemolytica]|uniref:3'-5' exonuclease n=1 Tax=Serratia microhaemolytica TaxID=2675110 RepID=UPI000FDCE0FB|nr:3'-5' exonuclease [Serratia microhaemolytica]
MNNLMLDLETMGTGPTAPIVAIGAVFFEPSTGELGSQFYNTVDLSSDMAKGAIPDGETIKWWLKQSDEARAAIVSEHAIPIVYALLNLSDFIENFADKNTLEVWGNGASFDNVILRSAYERAGLTPKLFWNWWNDRDVRTVVALGKQIGFDPKRDLPFEGERHHALADAIHQARYVSAIYQRLIGQEE